MKPNWIILFEAECFCLSLCRNESFADAFLVSLHLLTLQAHFWFKLTSKKKFPEYLIWIYFSVSADWGLCGGFSNRGTIVTGNDDGLALPWGNLVIHRKLWAVVILNIFFFQLQHWKLKEVDVTHWGSCGHTIAMEMEIWSKQSSIQRCFL